MAVLPTRPDGVSAFGKESWFWFPAVAVITAPTVAEVGAATALDLTCRLYREGGGAITADTERLARPPRLCDLEEYEVLGATKITISDLLVSYNPQGATASEGKKAFETLTAGTTGFLGRRQGIAKDTALAAGQFIDVLPSSFAGGIPGKTSDGKEAEFSAQIAAAITGPVAWNKVIVT